LLAKAANPTLCLLIAPFYDRLIGVEVAVKTRAAKVRPRTFPILPGCFGRGEYLYLQFASNIFTQKLENTLRKIIVSMRITLDGFIAGPHGEMA